jgi:hypothetical protein
MFEGVVITSVIFCSSYFSIISKDSENELPRLGVSNTISPFGCIGRELSCGAGYHPAKGEKPVLQRSFSALSLCIAP